MLWQVNIFPVIFQGCGKSCLKVVKDPGTEVLGPDEEDHVIPEVNPNAPKIRVSAAM